MGKRYDFESSLIKFLYDVANFVFFVIKKIGELIKQFGMPTVAVGAGVSVVLLLFKYDGKNAIVYQVAVGLALVILGLVTQLMIHFRANPPKYPAPPPTDPALVHILNEMLVIIKRRENHSAIIDKERLDEKNNQDE